MSRPQNLYLCVMFVRKKKNKSGSISIQVINKSDSTGYKVIKTFGCSSDPDDIERFYKEACKWADEAEYGLDLFADEDDDARQYDKAMSTISQNQLRLVGPELIYGTLFDRIGYNRIKTSDATLLRALVVTRLYRPGSKLRTVEYLSRFMHVDYSVDKVYRFLDRLCAREENGKVKDESKEVKWQVEDISFAHTRALMGGEVSVIFYDTTTLYFESREDDLRVPGYSKDGKNSNPQVVLGLLVGTGGNPIGYEIHKGNRYEGDTLIPIIQKMEKRFGLSHPTVIADAGLLNKHNIEGLEKGGYTYIIGSRIKSMKQTVKENVLALELKNGEAKSIEVDGKRMVVSMSEKRAIKDVKDREKGIARLRKRFTSGKITKQNINNRGYNRLLSIKGDMTAIIDETKVEELARFDGLKGYMSNTALPDTEIISNYGYLHMIERAFRFNKTDLDIRPMFHRLANRIEAHVCICFTAYTIMLELERLLKKLAPDISLQRAMFLAEGIQELCYINPYSNKTMSVMLKTDHDDEVTLLLKAVRQEEI